MGKAAPEMDRGPVSLTRRATARLPSTRAQAEGSSAEATSQVSPKLPPGERSAARAIWMSSRSPNLARTSSWRLSGSASLRFIGTASVLRL